MPIYPAGEIAITITRPHVCWAGRGESVQEGLVTSGVNAIQSDVNKVRVSLGEVVCGREELDVWVGDFVCLAINEIPEVYEHISVAD